MSASDVGIASPHGEERGKSARLEPCGAYTVKMISRFAFATRETALCEMAKHEA
jgi:hypothetical protein